MRAKSLRRAEGKRESMKPVIGIIAACTREVHPAYTTGHDYVRAVERAGGLALVLNVAFGGTLWQDIPAQCRAAICHYQDSAARGELFHSLTLAPDSLLARIMGPGQHECNTFHHQAVRDVAPGFAAAAHAPDGLVEAVESADGLALGVQWHPENLAPEHPDHAAIFTWLVDAAAGGALLKR